MAGHSRRVVPGEPAGRGVFGRPGEGRLQPDEAYPVDSPLATTTAPRPRNHHLPIPLALRRISHHHHHHRLPSAPATPGMGQILSTLWKGSKKGLGKLICGLGHVCSSLWNWMLERGLSKKERKRRKKKSREFWCSLLHTVQSFFFGRPSRQGVQVRQMVTAMEGMEARLVDFLRTEMQTAREEMNSHMAVVDRKLEQQGEKMEELQLKLTLSMDSIGQVQQDQVMVKKALNGIAPLHLVIPAREEAGILAARTREMRVQPAGRQEIPPAPNPQVLKFYSKNHSRM